MGKAVWRENFRAVIKEKKLAMKSVSLEAGLGETYVRDMLERDKDPTISNFVAVSKVLGIDPALMLATNGLPQKNGDTVEIPVYDIEASAGHGSLVDEGEPLHYQPFRQDFLKDRTRSKFGALSVIQVRGDSMWETLHDGDSVLIDRAQRSLARAGIFVLALEGELMIKRVSMNPVTKLVTVKSDNPQYETFRDLDPDALSVVGKVIWIGRAV